MARTGRYLKSVTKDGVRITSLQTKMAPLSKGFCGWHLRGRSHGGGRSGLGYRCEGGSEFGESFAGKRYPKEKMNISGFDDVGDLLPLVTTVATLVLMMRAITTS